MKVLVKYLGNGIWKDSKGVLWGKPNSKAVKSEREIEVESIDVLKDDRKDIAFMIDYGCMSVDAAEVDEEELDGNKEPANDELKQPAQQVVIGQPTTIITANK